MRDIDISERVAKVTQELRFLSEQMQWKSFQSSSQGDQALILNGLLKNGLVEDLRTAVDQLSQFLWCYIDSVAAQAAAEDSPVPAEHLQQITSMLRLLHQSACPTENPLAFVERMTAVVERRLEAHTKALPFRRM
jgi:hypothetical protein